MEVTHELVKTYLNIKDASIQESVWRILRSFPLHLVFKAVLDNIQELSKRTDWAPTLVDIFDDNLPEAILDELDHLLEQAPVDARRSYVSALEKAKKAGSLHAAQFLEKLYPES